MEDFTDEDIINEVTDNVIYTVQHNHALHDTLKELAGETKDPDVAIDKVAQECYDYAEDNNGEFGEMLQDELDMVDWHDVIRSL